MGRHKTGKGRGYFISFEGGEGSGKSTQMGLLLDWLRGQGLPAETSREPGGTEVGLKIRQILLDPAHTQLTPRAELFLYLADRAQHAEERIRPALEAGKILVSDRFGESSVVYQGICRGLGVNRTIELNDFATRQLQSDLVVLLDLPETLGLERARKRTALDRLEQENPAFHRRVRQGFLKLARRFPRRFAVIDAARSEAEVATAVRVVVANRLKRRKLWTPQ